MVTLDSAECVSLLERALARALQKEQEEKDPHNHQYNRQRLLLLENQRQQQQSSGEEFSSSSSSSSSSLESDQEEEEQQQQQQPETSSTILSITDERSTQQQKKNLPPQQQVEVVDDYSNTTTTPSPKTTLLSSSSSKKRDMAQLYRQLGTPPMHSFVVNDSLMLELPSALLVSKNDNDEVSQCRSALTLAQTLSSSPNNNTNSNYSCSIVVVLLVRSGRFAGAVVRGRRAVAHRAVARYTVRRGQGKAQSSMDNNNKKKAQSMGAQLRRAGEEQLRQDVRDTLKEWRDYLRDDAALILWSCPKTMRSVLFGEDEGPLLQKEDERLRRIPLDVGRPTFESVCAVHDVMLQGMLRTAVVQEQKESMMEEEEKPPELVSESAKEVSEGTKETAKVEREEVIPVVPLTRLHQYAAEGTLDALRELLCDDDQIEDHIDQPAGEDRMTPLHYAAQSTSTAAGADPAIAADVVTALLVQGHANPCMVDARNRVPYYLATHDKVRDAFRKARATLGEECWSWDDGAKVGPPLTQDDLERKKEKAAEKKRRQKARQKEKKAKEKAQAEEMTKRMKEEEEKRKEEEDAKRIRDGLQPKGTAATNVCDFCQKVCKGKRRSQMFQRLEYVYCSSECVAKHKRELMASAALSRIG